MTRREVLETLVDRWEALVETYFSGCPQDELIAEALTALDKLEKEKMLEIVGDGEPQFLRKGKVKEGIAWYEGRQQLRAEIRKKVMGL